jgi:hypothetical protein
MGCMKDRYNGILPDETNSTTRSYLQLFEGLVLDDPAVLGDAARALIDKGVGGAISIERSVHEAESSLLTSGQIHPIPGGKIAYDSLRSMIYSGYLDISSDEQIDMVKTYLSLLGKDKKWLKSALSASPQAIERAGYREKGDSHYAALMGKEALKALKPRSGPVERVKRGAFFLLVNLGNIHLHPETLMHRLKKPKK